MKRIILCVALCLMAMASFAQGGKSIYKKFSDKPDVDAVYISSTMFKMMGKLPGIEFSDEGIDISPIVKSLTGMYVLESENEGVSRQLLASVRSLVSDSRYELLMESKEDEDVTFMYTLENDGYIDSFVILTSDGDDCTFVCFEGKILLEDFQNLIASVNE